MPPWLHSVACKSRTVGKLKQLKRRLNMLRIAPLWLLSCQDPIAFDVHINKDGNPQASDAAMLCSDGFDPVHARGLRAMPAPQSALGTCVISHPAIGWLQVSFDSGQAGVIWSRITETRFQEPASLVGPAKLGSNQQAISHKLSQVPCAQILMQNAQVACAGYKCGRQRRADAFQIRSWWGFLV